MNRKFQVVDDASSVADHNYMRPVSYTHLDVYKRQVGGSWRLDQESFIASQPWISALKLRASYGSVGNDGTSSWYQWQSLYGILNNANASGFIQSTQAGNKELQWEKNRSFDVALEFGFFDNRLNGQIEMCIRDRFRALLPRCCCVRWRKSTDFCSYNIHVC